MRGSQYQDFNHYRRIRARKHPEKILQNRVNGAYNLLFKMGYDINKPDPDVYRDNFNSYLIDMQAREQAVESGGSK